MVEIQKFNTIEQIQRQLNDTFRYIPSIDCLNPKPSRDDNLLALAISHDEQIRVELDRIFTSHDKDLLSKYPFLKANKDSQYKSLEKGALQGSQRLETEALGTESDGLTLGVVELQETGGLETEARNEDENSTDKGSSHDEAGAAQVDLPIATVPLDATGDNLLPSEGHATTENEGLGDHLFVQQPLRTTTNVDGQNSGRVQPERICKTKRKLCCDVVGTRKKRKKKKQKVGGEHEVLLTGSVASDAIAPSDDLHPGEDCATTENEDPNAENQDAGISDAGKQVAVRVSRQTNNVGTPCSSISGVGARPPRTPQFSGSSTSSFSVNIALEISRNLNVKNVGVGQPTNFYTYASNPDFSMPSNYDADEVLDLLKFSSEKKFQKLETFMTVAHGMVATDVHQRKSRYSMLKYSQVAVAAMKELIKVKKLVEDLDTDGES